MTPEEKKQFDLLQEKYNKLEEAYDNMYHDLQFRIKQVRELQDKLNKHEN